MNNVFDATSDDFTDLVIEASHQQAVLVDFWAPWCAPCRQLKPLLEQFVQSGDHDIRLVKINTEEHTQIAAQMGVRGIPDVRLYRDGVEVDRFSGALPEPAIRAFVEKHVTSALAVSLAAIDAEEDGEKQLEAYRQLLATHPDNSEIKLAMAEVLVARQEAEEARSLLSGIGMQDDTYSTARAMLGLLELRQACAEAGQLQGVAKIYAQAACAAVEQDYERACEGFLEVVQKDKNYKNGAGRKALLNLFEVIGTDAPLTKQYQRRLAMYLH